MTTPPVYLRALDANDADRCLKWFQDPEVSQYILAGRQVLNRERELEWIANIYKSTTDAVFAICRTEDNAHIGNCGIHGIDWVDRNAWMGITLGEKDTWGKGLGTYATNLLLGHAFHVLGLNRVELEVFVTNTRAIKSYLKLGFVEEGRMRQRRYKLGAYQDVVWMAVLREDWQARQR